MSAYWIAIYKRIDDSSSLKVYAEKATVAIKKFNGKILIRGGKNTWVDEGEHRDVETPEVTPPPRNRKSPVKIEKKCHICGKSFKVNAALVSGEFIRCDSCTG